MIASLFLLFFADQNDPAAAIASARSKFAVDSADWTGIEERLHDEKSVAAIRVKLIELNDLVEHAGLTNYETDGQKPSPKRL